jgi:hypothetical protein
MKIEDVIREMRQYVEDDKYDPDVATWITFLEAAMREPVALIVKNRAGQIRLTDVDGNAFDLYDNLGTKLYALPPIDTRDESCRESADTSTCPHLVTSDEGTSYCDLAESAMRERDAEIERLREACTDALQELETMNYARYKTLEQKLRAALAQTEDK